MDYIPHNKIKELASPMNTKQTASNNSSADLTTMVTIDPSEVQRIVAQARAEQAEAMFELLVKPVGRFLRFLAGPVFAHIAASRISSELSRLSDRELADMGIRRSDIPYVVRYSLTDGRFPAEVVDYAGVRNVPATGTASNDEGRTAAA